MKLFDAHNHIHLGPRGLTPLLETIPALPSVSEQLPPLLHGANHHPNAAFAGAAIMSTHPRDYNDVQCIVSDLRKRSYDAVACYGIHPWFLNDLLNDPEATKVLENGEEVWFHDLKQRLIQHPDAIIGEIGLDGARWVEVEDETDVAATENSDDKCTDNKSIWERKRVLACPMNLQKEAFVKQLLLAAQLKRPVSIHVVRAWGELFDSLDEVKEIMKQKYLQHQQVSEQENDNKQGKKRPKIKEALLPPKMYFHAFSGKAGVIASILSACGKGNIDPNTDVYFGFAPVIPNFYASKTPAIMREIGLHRLLLETDLEDASMTWNDLKRGVEGIAKALEVDGADVADRTYNNAMSFYFNSI